MSKDLNDNIYIDVFVEEISTKKVLDVVFYLLFKSFYRIKNKMEAVQSVQFFCYIIEKIE